MHAFSRSIQLLPAVALIAASCVPLHAQQRQPCSTITGALAKTRSAAEVAPSPRQAGPTALSTVVTGGGQATLTDTDGQTFTHQFTISAILNTDGSAQGQASLVFSQAFASKWGALPGVDVMHVQGTFTTGGIAPSGSVWLSGPFLETDFNRTEGIVFQENSAVSGSAPMKVTIAPDTKSFTLSWCSFIPAPGFFTVVPTDGSLRVR